MRDFNLSLTGDTFQELKADVDTILQETLEQMERKTSNKAEITVKLTISLADMKAPDNQEKRIGGTRKVAVPAFSHKVSSIIKTQLGTDGELEGDYELLFDEQSGRYVMQKIEDPQQTLAGLK